jgi:hypothetical protein
MNAPRTVASMYGTGLPVEESPTVARVIDREDWHVEVDLTPAAGILLQALAAAIAADDALLGRFTLLVNISRGAAHDQAVRELLSSAPVRRALTVHLTPETAEHLRDRLDEQSVEPGRCQYGAGVRSPEPGCGRFVEDGERVCGQHADPDDFEGYQL